MDGSAPGHDNGDVNSFFAMMPSWMFWPAVIIATSAAIIASQALISGTFTLFNEAIRLNFFPRLTVYYPSNVRGQLYIPAVNWALLTACYAVVLFFKKSANMEAAFGLSVTLTMLMTTGLLNFYLLFVKRTNRLEILSSIYYHQPKRADVYWLLHIEVTDEPDTSSYVVETIQKNEVMRITYFLGFRIVPRLNILFKKVLNDLFIKGEFETSDTWKIFYRHNPAGDYRFVLLDNYLSHDNELPLWKKIPLKIYFFLKRLNVAAEESYNLDYSLVTTEKVPLIVESPGIIKLKRIPGDDPERLKQ